MNKAFVWLVGTVVAVFLGLIIIGTIAVKSVDKDIEELKSKKEKQAELENSAIQGNGQGTDVVIEDGVTIWVHSIKTGRYGDTAVVPIAIKNTSENDFIYKKKYLYLEDTNGEQYPIKDLGNEESENEIIVKPGSISEGQEGFMIPDGYDGEYKGWNIVYDDGTQQIYIEVKTIWEDSE